MKRLMVLVLLLFSLFLSACTPNDNSRIPMNETQSPAVEEEPSIAETLIYTPSHSLTIEETIYQYFEQQYEAYINLQYIDFTSLLDMSEARNRNSVVWLKTLIQRRRLIEENGFAYIETVKFPYEILYEKEPRDERMDFWNRRGLIEKDEVIVHFTIKGQKGRVYPPLMAVNAQHTMRFKKIDDRWKITFHYFTGSTRRFHHSTTLVLPSKDEMLNNLKEEFKVSSSATSIPKTALPPNASGYNGRRAAEYAKTYSESRNPDFYSISDWSGNCSNFTSQSLWYGFGKNMTSEWFAGQGGGSPAWENVEQFWDYVTTPNNPHDQGLHGEVANKISQLHTGDIIQIRTGSFRENDDKYNHSLILVDDSKLILAQNSPDCLVYYSDLVNVETRFFKPRYLIE